MTCPPGSAGLSTPAAAAAPGHRPSERRNWADVLVDETPDYSLPLVWDDEAEEASTRQLLTARPPGR